MVIMSTPGNRIICPHCGEATPPQRKIRENQPGGFAVEEIFCCLFCGGVLNIKAEQEPVIQSKTQENHAGLKSFLGIDDDYETEKDILHVCESEKRFCRDCRFYVAHPFLSRCDKHKRSADPMGDCPDFVRREIKSKETETL